MAERLSTGAPWRSAWRPPLGWRTLLVPGSHGRTHGRASLAARRRCLRASRWRMCASSHWRPRPPSRQRPCRCRTPRARRSPRPARPASAPETPAPPAAEALAAESPRSHPPRRRNPPSNRQWRWPQPSKLRLPPSETRDGRRDGRLGTRRCRLGRCRLRMAGVDAPELQAVGQRARRGARRGPGRVGARGQRYQVHLDVTVGLPIAPLMTRRMSSDGELTPQGLAPRRYDEDTASWLRGRAGAA